jgi:hypothetical protein
VKVLVACEESQEVCKAFRALDHEAYSNDIQEPSGGHPEWHIMGDALAAIEGGASDYDGRTDARCRAVGFIDSTPTMHLFEQCRYTSLFPPVHTG